MSGHVANRLSKQDDVEGVFSPSSLFVSFGGYGSFTALPMVSAAPLIPEL